MYLTPVQVMNEVLVALIRVISNNVDVLDEVRYSYWRLAPDSFPHCW